MADDGMEWLLGRGFKACTTFTFTLITAALNPSKIVLGVILYKIISKYLDTVFVKHGVRSGSEIPVGLFSC